MGLDELTQPFVLRETLYVFILVFHLLESVHRRMHHLALLVDPLLIGHNFYLQVVLCDLVYDLLHFYVLISLLTKIIALLNRSLPYLEFLHHLAVIFHLTFLLPIIVVIFPLIIQNLLNMLSLRLRLISQLLPHNSFPCLLLHLDDVVEYFGLPLSAYFASGFKLFEHLVDGWPSVLY